MTDVNDRLETAASSSEPDAPAQRLTRALCRLILRGFREARKSSVAITRGARGRFESRDWRGNQEAIGSRLDLYRRVVDEVCRQIQGELGPNADRELWAQVKDRFAQSVADSDVEELAQTFFNSVTRILLGTVGVDRRTEFVWFEPEIPLTGAETPVFVAYHYTLTIASTIRRILDDNAFGVPYEDEGRDARRVATALEAHLTEIWGSSHFDAIELVEDVFYRSKAAYLIGRVRRVDRIIPFILPLLNEERGIRVDAAILVEEDAHSLFSLTRNYFFVEVKRPGELVGFLRSILPAKPVAELYIALGFVKHGKTVMYRDLNRHLRYSTDKFEVAKGTKGMVMVVFTLPSYPLVFKVIRDTFDAPKDTTADRVKERYRLVSRQDRVGRLIDTQSFENLSFDRDRFGPDLLEELTTKASRSVTVAAREVVFRHVFVERRVEPLDVFLRESSAQRAQAAFLDMGQAIKDLAAANIFCGDLLMKNFGVTWHGRVVFYDYDELSLLEEIRFRRLPEPTDDDLYYGGDQVAFHVGKNDVFPEEFSTFLVPDPNLRGPFVERHGELFTVEFWQETKERISRGEAINFFPYPDSLRFDRSSKEEA